MTNKDYDEKISEVLVKAILEDNPDIRDITVDLGRKNNKIIYDAYLEMYRPQLTHKLRLLVLDKMQQEGLDLPVEPREVIDMIYKSTFLKNIGFDIHETHSVKRKIIRKTTPSQLYNVTKDEFSQDMQQNILQGYYEKNSSLQ